MVKSVDRGVEVSSQLCEFNYVGAGGPNSYTSLIFLLPNPTKHFFSFYWEITLSFVTNFLHSLPGFTYFNYLSNITTLRCVFLDDRDHV